MSLRREPIYINIEYYTGIFKEDTIRHLSVHFRNIVKAVISDPLVKLKDIEIISEDEQKQILYEFNDTAEEFPRDKTIHRLFDEQAEKTPDRTAVVGKAHGGMGAWMHGNISITFRVLNEKSNQLACYLHEKKRIQPGDRVGIWMTQSLYRPICILGILKAGAA